MEGFLKGMAWDLVKTLGVMALFAIPPAVFIWWLFRTKRAIRSRSVEPFTDRPLRPPGESLRLKIEELGDSFEIEALLSLGIPLFVGATFASNERLQRPILLGGSFLLMSTFVFVRARKLLRLAKELWNHRLGFEGERIVGEELNQLMIVGHLVFHDVPFDGFNVDHVIVGPAGLYAVETKTRRKPKSVEKGKQYKVVFDGNALRWPAGNETKSVEQAARGAIAVSKWLSQATGETVTAKPVLLVPGWWVESTGLGSVIAINPKQIHNALPMVGVAPLDRAQITRIAHQLRERCRMKAG